MINAQCCKRVFQIGSLPPVARFILMKPWLFMGDGAASDEDKEEAQAGNMEGGDEIDPLDAFMAVNDSEAASNAPAEEDEIDPLDAFMAAQLLPSSQHIPISAPLSTTAATQLPTTQIKLEFGLENVPGKVAASQTRPVSVKVEAPAMNGTVPKAASAAGLLVKRRPKRYYNSDDSSDDEVETASEDDEVSPSPFLPTSETLTLQTLSLQIPTAICNSLHIEPGAFIC